MNEKNVFTNEDYLELDQFIESLEQGFPHTDETIRSGLSLRAKLESITHPSLSTDTLTDTLYQAYKQLKKNPGGKEAVRMESPQLQSFMENVRLYLVSFPRSLPE